MLQWNGVPLQGRSAEEVAAVVADSKQDTHVELVVCRPIAARQPAQPWRTHKGVLISINNSDKTKKIIYANKKTNYPAFILPVHIIMDQSSPI